MNFQINCFYLSILLVLALPLQVAADDATSLPQQITNAEHALFQGEDRLAKLLIARSTEQNYELDKLEILLLLALDDTDEAEDKLKQLEQQFADNPQTYAFSAEVWRSIGHQVNIFSKSSRYQKAVAAKIKAGDIAPENAKYLTLKASALGQSSDYGGVEGAQQQVTEKIKGLDKKWGIIAQINLAQNTDDEEQGKLLAQQASQMFPNDFYVLERVAQYYWTGKQYDNAQRFFYQACKHNPYAEWHTQVKWFNACYLTARFTKDKGLSVKYGIEALEILLKEYNLVTEENFEVAELLYEIDKEKVSKSATLFFERTLVEANDKKLVKKARKFIKNL